MSVGRPSSQLWVNLLQYVGWASPNFVVDLVHAIGFGIGPNLWVRLLHEYGST